MNLTRRAFLGGGISAAALALAGAEILLPRDPKRVYFLPPHIQRLTWEVFPDFTVAGYAQSPTWWHKHRAAMDAHITSQKALLEHLKRAWEDHTVKQPNYIVARQATFDALRQSVERQVGDVSGYVWAAL